MIIKFDKPTKASSNKGESGGYFNYMRKEDMRYPDNKELHFNSEDDMISDYRAQSIIDGNVKGLRNNEAKFYTGSISFSPTELKHINNDPAKYKAFCNEFFRLYANNFKRGFDRSDFNYFCKLERKRYYKYNDPLVKSGKVKVGDSKPDRYSMHVHFIVGRNTRNGKKASPKTNHQNNSEGAVNTSFNRDELFEKAEELFDKMFDYKRPLSESYRHLNNQKKESVISKIGHLNNSFLTDSSRVKLFLKTMNQELHREFHLSIDDICPKNGTPNAKLVNCFIQGASNGIKPLLSSIYLIDEIKGLPSKDFNRSLVNEVNKTIKEGRIKVLQPLNPSFAIGLYDHYDQAAVKSALLSLKGIIQHDNTYVENQNLNFMLFSMLVQLGRKYNQIAKPLRLQQLRKYINYLNSALKGKVSDNIGVEQVVKMEKDFGYSGKSLRYLNAINQKIKKGDFDGARDLINLSPTDYIQRINNDKGRGELKSSKTSSSFFDFDHNSNQGNSLFSTLPGFLFTQNDDDKDWNLRRKKKKKKRKQ